MEEYKNRKLRNEWREYLFKKQKGLCHYCQQSMSLTSRTKKGAPARNFATFEHLQRKQNGGKMNSTNIVLAHTKCNRLANIEAQKKCINNPNQF